MPDLPVLARSALCSGAAVALCLAPATALAQEQIDTPILATDPNFRDLAGPAGEAYGGTGYADLTSHGGVMRTGVANSPWPSTASRPSLRAC